MVGIQRGIFGTPTHIHTHTHTHTHTPLFCVLSQVLVEGAGRLDVNVFEQGSGSVSLLASLDVLMAYEPRASAIPAAIDFTDCPYMWPYCDMPVFPSLLFPCWLIFVWCRVAVAPRRSSIIAS